jgi:hypothetical protein
MGFDLNTGGDSQLKPKDQIQPDPDKPNSRKDNVYDPKDKVFKFAQGTTIVNAITEVLLMSEFCKTSVTSPSDKMGLKKWFRIETQVFNLKPQPGNNNRAKLPKLYVFKVVEYSVHEHRFKPPGAQPQGYEELKKNAEMHDVPIILISHVRKTAKGESAGIDDLRGSSYIAQDADVVLMVGRDADDQSKLFVRIEKNRNRGYDYKNNLAEMYMEGITIHDSEPIVDVFPISTV